MNKLVTKILTLTLILLTVIKLNTIIINSKWPMLIGLSILISLNLVIFFQYKKFFDKNTKLKFLN